MHVYHQYTIRVPEDRDGFAARPARNSSTSAPACSTRCRTTASPRSSVEVDLPETERAAAECLSLPVHPSLSHADLERVVTAVNTLAKAGA